MTVKPPRTEDQGELEKYRQDICANLNDVLGRVAAADADSTATTILGLRADFNDLLAKLRTAGLLTT